MGIRATEIKMGVKSKPGVLHNIDDPYSHLAVSIIIQAYEDLVALDGAEKAVIDSSTVGRAEILRFLRSEWCGLLLSCQTAVTQERIESAALAVLNN
jgi:hypothetical protein